MRSARLRSPTAVSLVALALVLAGCSTEPTSTPTTPSAAEFPFPAAGNPTGRVVMKLAVGDVASATAIVSRLGGKIERSIPAIRIYEVSGIDNSRISALRGTATVSAAGRDFKQRFVPTISQRANSVSVTGIRAQGTDQSGAFFFPVQWNIRRISANLAWAATPAGTGALVCVLDTGVDAGQLDLVGRVELGKSASMVASEPFIEDLNTHGTYVSSIISSNGIGMASVAPNARLCMVKVLDQTGSGSFFDIVAGIVFAAEQGADVINLSLRGYVDVSNGDQRALFRFVQEAVDFARRSGVMVVAAAGNEAVDMDEFPTFRVIPAQVEGVVGVSATAPFNQDRFDALASYSNFGTTLVDIAAPGGDLLPEGQLADLVIGACSRFVCGGDGFYLFGAGTSGAAPHVAGAGAVTESNIPGNQGEERLRTCVLAGADFVKGLLPKQQGSGRLNVLHGARCEGR
jgi:subtilisin family serine protease